MAAKVIWLPPFLPIISNLAAEVNASSARNCASDVASIKWGSRRAVRSIQGGLFIRYVSYYWFKIDEKYGTVPATARATRPWVPKFAAP
jgi:hypothetical protein